MSWTHIEDKDVVAGKTHRCFLCGRAIEAGTKYLRRTGVEDGEGFSRYLMHHECEAHTRDWREQDWETSMSPAEFRANYLTKAAQGVTGSQDVPKTPGCTLDTWKLESALAAIRNSRIAFLEAKVEDLTQRLTAEIRSNAK